MGGGLGAKHAHVLVPQECHYTHREKEDQRGGEGVLTGAQSSRTLTITSPLYHTHGLKTEIPPFTPDMKTACALDADSGPSPPPPPIPEPHYRATNTNQHSKKE